MSASSQNSATVKPALERASLPRAVAVRASAAPQAATTCHGSFALFTRRGV
jgi:hypothetical protein